MNQQNKQIPLKKAKQFLNNIKVMKELNSPTIINRELLKSFQGFGGLKQCFWHKKLFGRLMREIRHLFGSDREYEILNSLKNSVKSAYYTPDEVIKFIYAYLEKVCNFKGGNILEPSCGSGRFFELIPNSIMENSHITGVEYEPVTSEIVKSLYPELNIINDSFQNIDFKAQKFDLIIGNPPYSDEKITGIYIHNYFIIKSIRLLKDDGLLVFLMPSFFMDGESNRKIRQLVQNEAVIIDVLRLPDNLFDQSHVTVDLIILRKTGTQIFDISQTRRYCNKSDSPSINTFFINNPEQVFGDHRIEWNYKLNQPSLNCKENTKKTLKGISNEESYFHAKERNFSRMC